MPICPQCLKENPELGAKCPRCADSYYVYDEAADEGERDPYIGHKAGGKYVIIARISEGGMGTVYRALQLPVEREVAFKVLRAELEDNDEVRDRFTREARAVSKINHPNIITLHDFGFDESDYPYMVMEYAPGQNLDDWIYEDWVSLERILHVIRQILSALADAHEQGVVHRDLKPENIMVTGTGTDQDFIKLLDFGIARLVNEQATEGLTREGEVFGTPHYMSPEQAEGETGIGPPADVYAIGIMLYEMLCRECPFDAPKPLSILFKQINEELPSLAPRKGVTIPAALENLMRKATAKDPDERFATAGEMLEELEKVDNPERSGIVQAAQNDGSNGQTTQRGLGESQATPQPESQADGPANPGTGTQPSPDTSAPADQSSERRDEVATANTLGFVEDEHEARPESDSGPGTDTPPSQNDVSVDEPADELFDLEDEQDEEDNSTILAAIGVLTVLVVAGFTTLSLMGGEQDSEPATVESEKGNDNTTVAAGETLDEKDTDTTGGLPLGDNPDVGSSDQDDESEVAAEGPDTDTASDDEATGRADRSDDETSDDDESGGSASDSTTETPAGTESTSTSNGTRTGGTEPSGGGREASSDNESDDSDSEFDLEPDKIGEDDSRTKSDEPDSQTDPDPVSESDSTEETQEPQTWGSSDPESEPSDSSDSESSGSESNDDSDLEKFGAPEQKADDNSDDSDDGPSKFGAPGE